MLGSLTLATCRCRAATEIYLLTYLRGCPLGESASQSVTLSCEQGLAPAPGPHPWEPLGRHGSGTRLRHRRHVTSSRDRGGGGLAV